MPLDTSTYALSLLRLDGRRWNELRRISAQISTQAASDGSSYLEMGNTKVICTISGPSEGRRGGGAGGDDGKATVEVEVGLAGFSGERKRKGRGDRRISEIQATIASAFSSSLFTHLYPHSTIHISLSILSLDGALLAACINAATLALIDAGVPMSDYVVACTSGSTAAMYSTDQGPNTEATDAPDPLLDLNSGEELELPWLTVATIGAGERVSVLLLEKRVRAEWVEGMLAVGVDGCKQVREILDGVVRRHGQRVLEVGLG
ncbi:Exosome non-catalytic core component [Lobaria immixta]|nr:Exosome non-catalytic core component [Lobaria immixta]